MKYFFDTDCSYADAKIVITPVPWDVTTSYGGGTSQAPQAILTASSQIDTYSPELPAGFKHEYFLSQVSDQIFKQSQDLKSQVTAQQGHDTYSEELLSSVNSASDKLNEWLYKETKQLIKDNKIPASLGGDHSTPFGCIKAVAEHHQNDYSILHFDAHHDLRDSYQGFQHSHASIFHNVMESDFKPKKLVQVGIRDFCEEEFTYARKDESISVFYDRDLKELEIEDGLPWKTIADQIISPLSENVYISLDIDGFDPKLCPNTGTPVPGGLDFHHFLALLKKLRSSGKKLIGFDLVEVCPGPSSEWDANVGMRVLFELCKTASITNR